MKDGIILFLAGLPSVLASSGLPDVEGDWFIKLLASVGCMLWIWNQGKAAMGKGKKSFPQPLNVELVKTLATKEEVEMMERQIHDLFERERTIARQSLGKTHQRIDKQTEKLGELVGGVDSLKQQLQLLLQKGLNQG